MQPSAAGPVEALVPAVQDTEAVVPAEPKVAAAAVLSPIAEGSHESGSTEGTQGTQGTPEELKAAKAIMRSAFAPKVVESAGVEESKGGEEE
jgi:hypothetical protein